MHLTGPDPGTFKKPPIYSPKVMTFTPHYRLNNLAHHEKEQKAQIAGKTRKPCITYGQQNGR